MRRIKNRISFASLPFLNEFQRLPTISPGVPKTWNIHCAH